MIKLLAPNEQQVRDRIERIENRLLNNYRNLHDAEEWLDAGWAGTTVGVLTGIINDLRVACREDEDRIQALRSLIDNQGKESNATHHHSRAGD